MFCSICFNASSRSWKQWALLWLSTGGHTVYTQEFQPVFFLFFSDLSFINNQLKRCNLLTADAVLLCKKTTGAD